MTQPQTPQERAHYRNRQRGEYVQHQRSKERKQYRQELLEEAIDVAYRALADGDYPMAAEIALEELIPELGLEQRNFYVETQAYRSAHGPWNGAAVLALLQRPAEYCSLGSTSRDDGFEPTAKNSHNAQTVEQAIDSLVTALAVEGDVDGNITVEVPAYEYEHQVGMRYYRATSSASDALEMANDDDWEATLLTGGQGSAKTASRFTITEDRIAREHKVVDLVDMFKCENGMYDVECRHSKLNDIRARAGVDVGFEEYDPPEIEILLPLTHELSDSQVPYDTDAEEFVAKPFVIPASDLTYRQLVMLLPHTTKTQENYLRSAHQMLTQSGRDWTLRDVAEAVCRHTNAGEAVADRIERACETAQDKSFIRDEASDYCLDWNEIMADGGTVSAFSTYMIREKSDKLAITSWLLDSLYQARLDLLRTHSLEDYPPLTTGIGEAHKVAPRQKAEQDAEATIEGDMIDTFSELIALMRHVNMEIIADTQKFKQQLSPSVSGLFHRVFAFSGQKPDIKQVFRTRVDDTGPAETVATFETAKCALVGSDGYSMPIKMLPPRMHHLDAKRDPDGLGARAKYLDHEELRDVPWSADIPPRLRFNDMERGPVAEFVYHHVEKTGSKDDFIPKQEFTDLFNDWATANGHTENNHQSVCKLIKRKTDFDEFRPLVDGKQQSAWRGIVVTYEPDSDPDIGGENHNTAVG